MADERGREMRSCPTRRHIRTINRDDMAGRMRLQGATVVLQGATVVLQGAAVVLQGATVVLQGSTVEARCASR
jgi:hypothetical protein